MKNIYISIVLCVLIFSGCAPSVKVSVDYDRTAVFSSFKTYQLVDMATKGEVNPLNAERILNAIRTNMKNKGFTEVDADADLMVNAVTIVKNKQTITASSNYYGYGGIYRPYGYWGGGSGGTTTFNSYEYKAGSLIIDIVNNKAQKLLWQGIGNAEIDNPPSDPDKFINNAVTKILDGFPPKSSGK